MVNSWVVYPAVVSQADIVPLIQNFSNWNAEIVYMLQRVMKLGFAVGNRHKGGVFPDGIHVFVVSRSVDFSQL